jgi:hypothetical protein
MGHAHAQAKEKLINLCALCAFVVKFGMISCFMLAAWPAFGQNDLTERLQSDLVNSGFENVAVLLEDRQLIVTYENRIYRDEIRAAQEVLTILLPALKEGVTVTLIPQNRRIPLAAISFPADQELALAKGEASSPRFFSQAVVALEVEPFWSKVRALPKANSSSGRFDLIVHPQFSAQFGKRTDPVESQTNLAPEINVSLWPGMALSAQGIIPLQNDLEKEGDYWRPGLITLNQTVRLPQTIFAGFTAGYFTRNRYGTDLAAKKYFMNGRVAIGANIGYTGFASYYKGTWRYSTINALAALVHADYRQVPFDLTLRATYGQFLQQDKGWRFDMQRQFREVDIGFYVFKTEFGTNGGFNFSVPIFPAKYPRAGTIRARTAAYFPWEYRYWGLNDNGVIYNHGNSLNQFLKRLNPDHLKNH